MLPLRRWDGSQAAQCRPGPSLAELRRKMITTGRRRAAVTSADGRLLGLLCLQASQAGFCSDQDVRARARGKADPAAVASAGVD
jgi:hypothetical protein